jgi:hypothetical protein
VAAGGLTALAIAGVTSAAFALPCSAAICYSDRVVQPKPSPAPAAGIPDVAAAAPDATPGAGGTAKAALAAGVIKLLLAAVAV